jgi:hypothetical protein
MATRWKSRDAHSAVGDRRAGKQPTLPRRMTFMAMIDDRPVLCETMSFDRYGRTVASCAVNGADLTEWLVRQELALDWPCYMYFAFGPYAEDGQRPALPIRVKFLPALRPGPAYLFGALRAPAAVVATFPVFFPGCAVARALAACQLLALEFSFCLSLCVMGPLLALFPPPHS